jgi:hypothetical protein
MHKGGEFFNIKINPTYPANREEFCGRIMVIEPIPLTASPYHEVSSPSNVVVQLKIIFEESLSKNDMFSIETCERPNTWSSWIFNDPFLPLPLPDALPLLEEDEALDVSVLVANGDIRATLSLLIAMASVGRPKKTPRT